MGLLIRIGRKKQPAQHEAERVLPNAKPSRAKPLSNLARHGQAEYRRPTSGLQEPSGRKKKPAQRP
jgi:hypothetical protein